MITWQDLQAAGDSEAAVMQFIDNAIARYKTSAEYRKTITASEYYKGHNVTIEKYEKIIYDMQGLAHKNRWAANHKIACKFYPLVIKQAVGYLLGNGITFQNDETSEKLGKTFDQDMFGAAVKAQNGGVSFIYPELQPYKDGEKETYKMRVFSRAEFIPLYDENTGALKAGIRFWQLNKENAPLRSTLYDIDGYTEYIKNADTNSIKSEMQVLQPKRPYKIKIKSSVIDGTEITPAEPYPDFPIVPYKNNDDMLSELTGKQSTVDALDLAMSSMINNVDEGNLIYWVIKNCGGMDGEEDERFLEQLAATHVLHVDTNEGSGAEPHSIEAPFVGTEATIDMLKKQLFEAFQAFDSSAVSAGNQTATAIKACYVPLDLKTDLFEMQTTRTILDILRLCGIDDKPSYTRSTIINKSEEIQNVLMSAEYLSEDYITKKILTILGDIDQLDDVVAQKTEDTMSRTPTITREVIEE